MVELVEDSVVACAAPVTIVCPSRVGSKRGLRDVSNGYTDLLL